jgi:hypothetical protein
MFHLIRRTPGQTIAVAAAAAAVASLRRRSLRWGATDHELTEILPGDDVLGRAGLISTRAITIRSSPEDVWPWIAQLGQGRAGFYSYDFIENLVGCEIHSAETVMAQWQDIAVGDQVRLHPDVSLVVSVVKPGRALVLRGAVPMGDVTAPYDMTWAFVLHDEPGGATRLLVRERYQYQAWWAALLVEPVELVSLVMSQRMLRGIKRRAEQARPLMPTPSLPDAIDLSRHSNEHDERVTPARD